jgi:UDP:flavonoid glycosyltransferase YjiC (YdhE family)
MGSRRVESRASKLNRMKVLIASTPLTGHLNPLLAIGRALIGDGHEVLGLSARVMRDRIERSGAEFRAFPAAADLDLSDRDALFPEWKKIPPGPERLRFALEHVYVDAIQPQHEGLRYQRGYGSVNQALSFGVPLVTAGLTEDKADVNARVAWSGVGIDLATNSPTPQALRKAVRAVLENPNYCARASSMAEEFRGIDTRHEVFRILRHAAGVTNRNRSIQDGRQGAGLVARRTCDRSS